MGGVTSGISVEAADRMQDRLAGALPVACRLFDTYWQASLEMGTRLGTWGDDAPACYISAIGAEEPQYYGDKIRVLGCHGGDVCAVFPPGAYDPPDGRGDRYGYAPRTSYMGSVIRANNLARANLVERLGTPRADGYSRLSVRRSGNRRTRSCYSIWRAGLSWSMRSSGRLRCWNTIGR